MVGRTVFFKKKTLPPKVFYNNPPPFPYHENYGKDRPPHLMKLLSFIIYTAVKHKRICWMSI